MKIMITGYSGSGKSTLCRKLAESFRLPSLHLDTVQFLPGWEVRPAEEKQKIVADFLDNNSGGWVIDGNYTKLSYERRAEEADVIVQLLFNRIDCLCRCRKRFTKYRGTSRPDMTQGCPEKLDWAFVQWILRKGRTKEVRNRFADVRKQYPDKVVVIKNQRQLDEYLSKTERSSLFSG